MSGRAAERDDAVDYSHLYRSLVRRGRVPPSEIGRLTLAQALVILDDSDPNDPHRGNTVIESEEQLAELLGYHD